MKRYKTNIEQIMYDALAGAKIIFSFQHPVRGKYGYNLDFFLPEYNLAIECDGEHYHSSTKAKTHDRKRDWFLLRVRGIKTLRFKGKEIMGDIDSCLTKIKQEVKQHGEN